MSGIRSRRCVYLLRICNILQRIYTFFLLNCQGFTDWPQKYIINGLNLIKIGLNSWLPGEQWTSHALWYHISSSLYCLLFTGEGENIESYLQSELLLQHGSRQPLRAKTTDLAWTSFENKPELSLAQDVYLSRKCRLCCSGADWHSRGFYLIFSLWIHWLWLYLCECTACMI